jgi:hypothetical protein
VSLRLKEALKGRGIEVTDFREVAQRGRVRMPFFPLTSPAGY